MEVIANLKYKKLQKRKIKGSENNINSIKLCFARYGLRSLDNGILTPSQIESIWVILVNKSNWKVKIWMWIFPNRVCTLKSSESWMGKGKGSFENYLFSVREGAIILEFEEVSLGEVYKDILKDIASKLPVRLRLVKLI